ncbi:Laminin N-terminal (Domain VI) [Popillia japonica]|uniref:Laminin N-terminal (Domain VI) n=1 Tax=Popillia japonica TaxID=7064 RepID=A0AAW1ICI0_POPJA
MGISPRPGLWVLEKSADYGLTYTPWQYFSDSAGDCLTYFGKDSNEPISRDDSYFYSIKDISIGGRCMCNGHADTCDNRDPNDPTILLCRCQHNTCGPKCDRCCPGYEQKAWRQSKSYSPFSCEPCNCFLHSRECVYDAETDRQRLSLDIHGKYEGGGVCQNCQHNTEGINCNRCKATFYRPYEKHWNETDVCQR